MVFPIPSPLPSLVPFPPSPLPSLVSFPPSPLSSHSLTPFLFLCFAFVTSHPLSLPLRLPPSPSLLPSPLQWCQVPSLLVTLSQQMTCHSTSSSGWSGKESLPLSLHRLISLGGTSTVHVCFSTHLLILLTHTVHVHAHCSVACTVHSVHVHV